MHKLVIVAAMIAAGVAVASVPAIAFDGQQSANAAQEQQTRDQAKAKLRAAIESRQYGRAVDVEHADVANEAPFNDCVHVTFPQCSESPNNR